MKILFCKVSCMKYYKGASDKDQPYNGGKFVDENGYGHEEYNYLPILVKENIEGISSEKEYCFGFVETKTTNQNRRNELHIEKIKGCELLRREESVEDVLVVWCTTSDLNETTVVGWYKHATVFRNYQPITIDFDDGTSEERGYNVIASSNDCVLLPSGERHRHIWSAPSVRRTRSYGFGQSLIWYALEDAAKNFTERLLENIEEYEGENWLIKYPE